MKKILPKKIYYAILLLVIGIITYFSILINYAINPIDEKNKVVIVDIPTGSSFLKLTEIPVLWFNSELTDEVLQYYCRIVTAPVSEGNNCTGIL